MARVTVEDCVTRVPNRFELVMLAAQRARNMSAGAQLTIERDNDKNPVVALREIAEDTIELGELEESLIKGLQKHVEMEEPDLEDMEALSIQQTVAEETTGAQPEAEIAEDVLTVQDDAVAADASGDVMPVMSENGTGE